MLGQALLQRPPGVTLSASAWAIPGITRAESLRAERSTKKTPSGKDESWKHVDQARQAMVSTARQRWRPR